MSLLGLLEEQAECVQDPAGPECRGPPGSLHGLCSTEPGPHLCSVVQLESPLAPRPGPEP